MSSSNNDLNVESVPATTLEPININVVKISEASKKQDNVYNMLATESNNNKHNNWNKLGKPEKIKQISNFVVEQASHFGILETELGDCKQYLIDSLDKKKLTCVKDINYNKELGKIVCIHNLVFNSTNRRFTFKRNEKRASTTKSLGAGKVPNKV
jgi:hypothetical protein